MRQQLAAEQAVLEQKRQERAARRRAREASLGSERASADGDAEAGA